MSRKTKDSELIEANELKPAKKTVKKTTKTTSKKAIADKKTKSSSSKTVKKAADKEKVVKKAASKTATASKKKTETAKIASSATKKKATSTKKTSSTTTRKSTSAKKASSTTKSTITAKKKTTSSKKVAAEKKFKSEYYDLPYFYNKTVVKVLAQTPKMLFIYWEVSEDDRKSFQKQFGEKFFEITRPVLIVFNDTLHYSFEVDINDFANSWYLHINDADCNYHVELGRRPINYENNQNVYIKNEENHVYIPYYVYLTSSNEMTSPNNRIMFDSLLKTIRFRNVKTGEIKERNITDFKFVSNFGIFTIKDLFKYLFPGENFDFENVFIGNPSSGNTSGMFSSQFK